MYVVRTVPNADNGQRKRSPTCEQPRRRLQAAESGTRSDEARTHGAAAAASHDKEQEEPVQPAARISLLTKGLHAEESVGRRGASRKERRKKRRLSLSAAHRRRCGKERSASRKGPSRLRIQRNDACGSGKDGASKKKMSEAWGARIVVILRDGSNLAPTPMAHLGLRFRPLRREKEGDEGAHAHEGKEGRRRTTPAARRR
ncbi:hypothetical protein MRX96_013661 [Rhipicephalus microplus]